MKIQEINFTDKTLTIYEIVPGGLHSHTYNLEDEAIYLRAKTTTDSWDLFVNEIDPEDAPTYKSTVPFGSINDNLAHLEFRRIKNVGVVKTQMTVGTAYNDNITFANSEGFYMIAKDTIGTDDLRNGKVNINLFLMEPLYADHAMYLKLIKAGNPTGAEYALEIGYKKLP